MGRLGMEMCWAILKDKTFDPVLELGIEANMLRAFARDAYQFIQEHYAKHNVYPARYTVLEELDIDDDYDFDVDEPLAFYAKKVRDRWTLNLQNSASEKLRNGLQNRDPMEVHDAATAIVAIGLDNMADLQGKIVNQRDNAEERWERYLTLKEHQGLMGYRTPWEELDRVTGGLRRGGLYTIAARLGLGKTWCALLMAAICEEQGARIGIVSPEMDRDSLELRRDAIVYKLPFPDLVRGELDSICEEQYQEALLRAAERTDVFIASEGYIRTVADCAVFVQERKLDVLFVDGMYLLDPDDAANSRTPWHERVMMVARGLKMLALRSKINVTATGQFNRSVRTGSTRAGTESLGHSDAIGQFSDVIIGLFQGDEERLNRQMHANLLKNRHGSPIQMLLNWDLYRMDFSVVSTEGGNQGRGNGGGGEGGGGQAGGFFDDGDFDDNLFDS